MQPTAPPVPQVSNQKLNEWEFLTDAPGEAGLAATEWQGFEFRPEVFGYEAGLCSRNHDPTRSDSATPPGLARSDMVVKVTRRRFLAVHWDTGLPLEQAAESWCTSRLDQHRNDANHTEAHLDHMSA